MLANPLKVGAPGPSFWGPGNAWTPAVRLFLLPRLRGQRRQGAVCFHRFGNDHACNQNPLGLEEAPGAPSFAFFLAKGGWRMPFALRAESSCPPRRWSSFETLFRFRRRQIVLAVTAFRPVLFFKFEPGAMSNPAASLFGSLVDGQAHCRLSLRDLTRGKLGQGREVELRLSDLLAGVSYA